MVKTTQSKKITTKQIIVRVAVVVIVLIIDLTFTGFLKFGFNVVKCGGMPIKVSSSPFWGGGTWYDLPGNYNPGGVHKVKYFCTVNDVRDFNPTIQQGV